MTTSKILRRSFAILALALTAASPALAAKKERIPMLTGVMACKAECDKLNKTVASQHQCYVNCERYWMCHGSDSTDTTCADKPAADALATGTGGVNNPGNTGTYSPGVVKPPKATDKIGGAAGKILGRIY